MSETFETSFQDRRCSQAGFGAARKIMRLLCLRVDCAMPTYIYETTDATKPVRTFEIAQSVHDDPLCIDPKTGEAARRVISAGYRILVPGKSVGPCVGSVGSH